MPFSNREIKILAGNACPQLAAAIVRELGAELAEMQIGTFSDGEVRCQ